MQPIQINGETVNDAYRLTGHTGGIRAMIGWKHFIITGSDDNSIKIWAASTGNCIKTLKGHTSRILCLTIWNGYIVSSGADSQIKIWDIVSGKCKKTLKECTSSANSLASTPDLLFAGGKDGDIYVWTSRYQLKGKLTGHGDWVNKLLIYNEKYLISCSDDKTIRKSVFPH
ncbi:uncharacterized protein [Blastocystis hominis]|uniref:Uncharacterized protein n=1 Tax=Blastocystis hominis TaxID=12968 RepID=D8M750_BLAHO|nr:uncharacterized protein [Blastocystis hominis]CBK23889.2 unnamed protein product [Blastocystis hominis]|eukprot:XP_012897937.1 uncharacterized protein [Blastocystis hominis]